MKTRNGFVSNSSSSSFILTYDKSKVLRDPKEIVNFILKNPHANVIYRGLNLANGEDIFELDNEQKKLIRLFPQKFIENSEHLKNTETVFEDEKNHMEAYVGNATLRQDPTASYWGNEIKVDMSDLPAPEEMSAPEMNVYMKWRLSNETSEIPQELLNKIKNYDTFYKVKEERQEKEKARQLEENKQKEINNLINLGVPKENIENEIIYIDDSNCDEDEYTFTERYITSETYDDQNSYLLRSKNSETYGTIESKPYAVFYDELISDRNNIIDYLTSHKEENNYIFFSNEAFNSLGYSEDLEIDFYGIANEEIECILNNKEDFLTTNREVHLLTNATIIIDPKNRISLKDKNCTMGYGVPVIISPGKDLVDFKESFINEN